MVRAKILTRTVYHSPPIKSLCVLTVLQVSFIFVDYTASTLYGLSGTSLRDLSEALGTIVHILNNRMPSSRTNASQKVAEISTRPVWQERNVSPLLFPILCLFISFKKERFFSYYLLPIFCSVETGFLVLFLFPDHKQVNSRDHKMQEYGLVQIIFLKHLALLHVL